MLRGGLSFSLLSSRLVSTLLRAVTQRCEQWPRRDVGSLLQKRQEFPINEVRVRSAELVRAPAIISGCHS
jgi:hypothetical protein